MENIIKEGRTRREFLKGAGAVMAGGVVVGVVGSQLACEELPGVANWWTAGSAPAAMAPKAAAYLVYDQLKCDGCNTCVLACSAVHEGVQSLSLGRLQIAKNPHGQFPEDIKVQVCRQCVYAPCVEVCPSGALHADPDNGNIRTVDEGVCADYQRSISPNVCRLCADNCPYTPSMAIWKPITGQSDIQGVAMLCDLCKSAPNWSETGGIDGKQACVEACPERMLKVIKTVPSQFEDEGYNLNFRTAEWDNLMNYSWPD
jgi:protein NrfC